jgi:putative addiction module CopG family antidote
MADIINCAIYDMMKPSPSGFGAPRINVSIGERWEGFVERIVKSGRYGSASEVVRDELRLVEGREVRRAAFLASVRADLLEVLAYVAETSGSVAVPEAFAAELRAQCHTKSG